MESFLTSTKTLKTCLLIRSVKNELLLVIDRLKVNGTIKNRLFEAIENAAQLGGDKLVIVKGDQDVLFNLSFAVESTGESYPEVTPKTFAFNNEEGMCLDCLGLGYQYGANLMQNQDIVGHSIISLLRSLWGYNFTEEAMDTLMIFLDAEKIDPFSPMYMLNTKQLNLIMNGSPEGKVYATKKGLQFRWAGINQTLAKAGRNASTEIRETVIPLLDEYECPTCQGARLNALARHVTIDNTPIHELCHMPIDQALDFINKVKTSKEDKKLLGEVIDQITKRMRFLLEVGLNYLSLDRKAPTLSGGEAQRIRLAKQLGSSLTGVLYVLDEPTIGLHPRDTHRLNTALQQLKELGNTILMVEHDPQTIRTADYILDFGPHAGEHGGHITARGTLKQILKDKESLTGAYLSGRKTLPVPEKRRKGSKKYLTVKNATKHNLKNIAVKFPIGVFNTLTGVSGSGKSTLMNDVLLPALKKGILHENTIDYQGAKISGIENFDRIISIDQNPVGQTVRSNVGTYVDVLTRMREFFAALPAAKMKGLQPKHFSFNHRAGMCTSCWGLGYKKVEMHFLPSVNVVCEDCKGSRLNPVSLEVKYAGKNLGEYFDTTVDEARIAFENHPRIVRILDTLISVGLGYLKLGQEVQTLSGGESQRIKLSRELAKRSTGKTLYLLDEPTTGLHFEDIKKLLAVLQKLVDKGNTLIVIEHNIDVIKNSDYIIDLGPDSGDAGGEIICTGTPEDIAKCKQSWTGKYLI
jgi:excinuclease ABC subunit A